VHSLELGALLCHRYPVGADSGGQVMGRRFTGCVLVTFATGLVATAGCVANPPPREKTVAKDDVANQIDAKVNERAGHNPDSVTCPGDLRAKVGAVLECQMTDNGQTSGVDVTVTSVDGDNVNFDIVETVNKDDVAKQISDQLTQQSGRRPTVTCPDSLKGDVGATLRCRLQDRGSTYGVTVTVTSADGGSVKFSFKVDDRPE
jgi:Domain of unknown function (DUF4333)